MAFLENFEFLILVIRIEHLQKQVFFIIKNILKNLLTFVCRYNIVYADTEREVLKIEKKSRAEYFRKRREFLKAFNVLIPNKEYDFIDKKLKEQNKTKTKWLLEKIEEEK